MVVLSDAHNVMGVWIGAWMIQIGLGEAVQQGAAVPGWSHPWVLAEAMPCWHRWSCCHTVGHTAGKPQLLSLVPSLLTIRPFCTVASGSPPSLNAYSHPRSQCQLPLCSPGKRLGNFSSVGVLNSDVPSFKTSICYFSTLFN